MRNKLLLLLAIRNVQRNRKSTMLNGVGITIAVILLLLILSVSKGIESQIMSRNIKFETGAVSLAIFKKTASWQNEAEGDLLLTKITAHLATTKEVESYAFRIYIPNSILYFNDENQKVGMIGLSRNEIPLLEHMLDINKGNASISNSKGIVISNAISDQLNIDVGDNCTLMVQSVDGAVNVEDFVVSGIFRYTSQQNKMSVYVDYDVSRLLYNTNLPSRILVSLYDNDKADIVKVGLLNEMGCGAAETPGEIECSGMKISSYNDHMGMAKSIAGINKYGMLMIAVFLILISFIGIWSMQIENISGRSKEIGSLLSFGFKRSFVKRIIIVEILYIGLVFFLAGFIVSFMIIGFTNLNNGIYLGESASFAFGSSIVNPVLVPKDILIVFLTVIIYPLLATLISLSSINKHKIIELLNGK